MATKRQFLNPQIFQKKGLFTLDDTRKAGVSHQTLYRWLKAGKILRAGRGRFIHPSNKLAPEEYEYAVACANFGKKAAVGGLTALFKYGLIEQVPQQVWVVVPTNKNSIQNVYRCLRTTTQLRDGVDDFNNYRMTNIERTLLEALKFASKIGPRVAINAVRKALKESLTTEAKLGNMASKLKMRNILEKYWESIVS